MYNFVSAHPVDGVSETEGRHLHNAKEDEVATAIGFVGQREGAELDNIVISDCGNFQSRYFTYFLRYQFANESQFEIAFPCSLS